MRDEARSHFSVVDVASDPRWAELAEVYTSDVFHSPRWARVLEASYGFDVQAYMDFDSRGNGAAGVAFVLVDDARGCRRVSLPFSDFSDPIGGDHDRRQRLVDALSTAGIPASIRCLRHAFDAGSASWRETSTFAWHRIDASRSEDEAWASIHSSARRAIRKAREAGVEVVSAADKDDLRDFFEMHMRVRKLKYGLLAQPYRFFEAIWEQFLEPEEGRLLLARIGGETVGGVLYLGWKKTLYYKFNASVSSQLGVRPNDLLIWEGLSYARRLGMDWLDFGVSDWEQDGLIRYKRKYATEEGIVRKLASGPPINDGFTPTLTELTRILVQPDVPDSTTEQAGDLLYGLFC